MGVCQKAQHFPNWVPPLQGSQHRVLLATKGWDMQPHPLLFKVGIPGLWPQVTGACWLEAPGSPQWAQALVFSGSADGFKGPPRSRTPAGSQHRETVWPRHHTTAKTLEAKNWHLWSVWSPAEHHQHHGQSPNMAQEMLL